MYVFEFVMKYKISRQYSIIAYLIELSLFNILSSIDSIAFPVAWGNVVRLFHEIEEER